MRPASRSPPAATTSRTRRRRRSPASAGGRRARHRLAAAPAAARCGAAQRHPRARPRFRRHPQRRHHPRHRQHLADGAGDRPHARRLGRRPLTAYVAGVEAATRLAAVGSGPFHQIGFHPTGLIGVFGCTLAAGTLMGLSPQRPRHGAGHRAVDGLGQPGVPGGRRLDQAHASGWAAQSGITAAALARQGFVGPSRAYEGRFGLFNAYLQAGIEAERWGRATAGLARSGRRWPSR